MIVTNYRKAREVLKRSSNKKKFLQLLKQGLKEEVQQRNAGREKIDFLKEVLGWFSETINSPGEIKARTFFRVLARQALDHHDQWVEPEDLYEKLIE